MAVSSHATSKEFSSALCHIIENNMVLGVRQTITVYIRRHFQRASCLLVSFKGEKFSVTLY